jgi:TfoX/Sxy family transcriptional regulator of competence genes
MAFDESLAERIREGLASDRGVTEQKMFGGIAFMLNGNMCAGVHGNDLIVRLDEPRHEAAMREKHTGPMVFGNGMAAKGLVLVAPAGVKTKAQLAGWLKRATDFAGSLPPKTKKKPAPKKTATSKPARRR